MFLVPQEEKNGAFGFHQWVCRLVVSKFQAKELCKFFFFVTIVPRH